MKTTNFVSLGSLFLATSFFWQDSTTQARPLNDAGISNASNDIGQVGPPRHTVLDFVPGTTQEEKEALRERYLGPGSGTYDFTINSRWPGAMGDPIELTWSIVPDGVGNSTLISTLDTQFAAAGLPDPRAAWVQVMENAFARWDELHPPLFHARIALDLGRLKALEPWSEEVGSKLVAVLVVALAVVLLLGLLTNGRFLWHFFREFRRL